MTPLKICFLGALALLLPVSTAAATLESTEVTGQLLDDTYRMIAGRYDAICDTFRDDICIADPVYEKTRYDELLQTFRESDVTRNEKQPILMIVRLFPEDNSTTYDIHTGVFFRVELSGRVLEHGSTNTYRLKLVDGNWHVSDMGLTFYDLG